MTIQSTIMVGIMLACAVSALDWYNKGMYAAVVTFVGFGIGYFGLAILFRSTQ